MYILLRRIEFLQVYYHSFLIGSFCVKECGRMFGVINDGTCKALRQVSMETRKNITFELNRFDSYSRKYII